MTTTGAEGGGGAEGDERVAVVTTSEVDHATCPAFEAEILPFLDPPPPRLVLDLGAVAFLDSSGLGVLLNARRAVDEAQGDLVLRNVQPPVRLLLEASGTLDLFRLDPP